MDVSSTHRTQSPDPRRAVLLTSKINSVISWSDKLAAQKRPSIYESIYRLAPPCTKRHSYPLILEHHRNNEPTCDTETTHGNTATLGPAPPFCPRSPCQVTKRGMRNATAESYLRLYRSHLCRPFSLFSMDARKIT